MALRTIIPRAVHLSSVNIVTKSVIVCSTNNNNRHYNVEHITIPSTFVQVHQCHSWSANTVQPRIHHQKEKEVLPGIELATCNSERKMLEIVWDEESRPSQYPYVWLRDHCQCEKCFHPVSLSRTMQLDDLDLNVTPVDVQVENKNMVNIKWSDGHRSRFLSNWLQERNFIDVKNKRQSIYKLDRIFWGSDILQNLPMANFQEILNDDSALLSWLQQLEVFGFVLIANAPTEKGQVRSLIDRVAFIKKTHYGAEFSVKAKPDPSNVAYSSGPLQLHTDLPYYDYKPGIQLIHCLVQYPGAGAESLIADAAHVAMQLQNKHPDLYNILTTVKVDWCDVGNDEGREFFKVLQLPVICLNNRGEIERINYSHPQRDSFFDVELDMVPKWYEALKVYSEMLNDPQNCIQFKMAPGTIQSFDNLRIVHGRRGYDDGEGEREIEGCYMDWDEARSKRRVLERKLSLNSEHWCRKATNN